MNIAARCSIQAAETASENGPSLGGYRSDITEQQLRGTPSLYRYRDYDWSDRERELHDYWRVPYRWGGI
jgi:hypothetical protein